MEEEEHEYYYYKTNKQKQQQQKNNLNLRNSINAHIVQEEINSIKQRSHSSTPLRNHYQDSL